MLREPFLTGFAQAMDRVFLVAAFVVLPAFLLSFFLKEVKLRMESGLEAQAAERAVAAAAVAGNPAAQVDERTAAQLGAGTGAAQDPRGAAARPLSRFSATAPAADKGERRPGHLR